MRRLSGVLLAGAIFILPAFSQPALAQEAAAAEDDLHGRGGDRGLRRQRGQGSRL